MRRGILLGTLLVVGGFAIGLSAARQGGQQPRVVQVAKLHENLYVLREMDLPARALGWSLFSFNVGVEIGQLCVVITAAAVLAAVRRWSPAASRRVAVAGSVAVIAAGGFWFVERVFLSGGLR